LSTKTVAKRCSPSKRIEELPVAVYLDYNATTPVARQVSKVMTSCLDQEFGNASSQDHMWGWSASDLVEQSRERVGALAGVSADSVVFTSGASEALNAVLRSYVGFTDWSGKLVVACATEHESILKPARWLADRTGARLKLVAAEPSGAVSLPQLRSALEGTHGSLVAVMAVNNEIGTCQRIESIVEVVRESGGLLLCDTTQAFGKQSINVSALGIDWATVSAHKIYGPKGVGALLAASEVARSSLEPLIAGSQERGLRGGTLNVPGIAGLGEACRLIEEQLEDDVQRIATLRDRLEKGIFDEVHDTWLNGDRSNRVCNTSNIGFRGVDARIMIRDMHDIGVSTKSACSSNDARPSHVLRAIGLSEADAHSCIRFSLGRFTTEAEIDYTIQKVGSSAHKLRRHKSVRP
jgi:cysteine desulfurase